MLGNFDFMRAPGRIEDYGGFVDECDRAERFYADGEYETSIFWSRKAIELIVRWIYAYPDFDMPAWLGDKTAMKAPHADRLSAPAFIRWIHDPGLRSELDRARLYGNDAAHMHWDAEATTALRCLKALHALTQLLEARIWEEPYIYEFFEPYYEQPEEPMYEEQPLERDYPALIEEARANGDDRLAAKWALLLRSMDRTYDIRPVYQALPEGTSIGRLIEVLLDKRALRALLQVSTVQLTQLIQRCYGDFDYRETDMIVTLAMRSCRSFTIASAAQITACLDRLTENTEALTHGEQ